MKHYVLTTLLVLSVLCLSAQTPFDSYAPEHRDKVMIELQNMEPFRVENADKESEARYAEFDSHLLNLNILDSANNVIAVIVLAPEDMKFMSVDPLSDKYPSASPYGYCNNNPVMFVDPDGREVKATFYKNKNELHVVDLDHYNENLSTIKVSASDYVYGGIRDQEGKLTQNQVLVIPNVFSGASSINGEFVDNGTEPLSNGTYDIVDTNADTEKKRMV